jgi:hypothetical protein
MKRILCSLFNLYEKKRSKAIVNRRRMMADTNGTGYDTIAYD